MLSTEWNLWPNVVANAQVDSFAACPCHQSAAPRISRPPCPERRFQPIALRRQVCNSPRLTPNRRATAATLAPGRALSATIAVFSSIVHRRRRTVPVISSIRGSLGEVVGDAAAKVEPDDIHSMARELYVMATDGGARNQLRAAGLAQARKFDWNRNAAETVRVYERVCGSSAEG